MQVLETYNNCIATLPKLMQHHVCFQVLTFISDENENIIMKKINRSTPNQPNLKTLYFKNELEILHEDHDDEPFLGMVTKMLTLAGGGHSMAPP